MIGVAITGVSVLGPGLALWAESAPILAGERDWTGGAVTPPPPALLPANERRRAGPPVRLALAVASEAVAMAGLAPSVPRAVFASSNGDGAVLDSIVRALTEPDGQVSPTQFHNSVHNAVVANWTIAAGSTRPATCIGMHDDTVAAGLLKAAAEAARSGEPVLFCAYDAPMPPPLDAARPTSFPFSWACVLARSADRPMAHLSVAYAAGPAPEAAWWPVRPGPRALGPGNPAARGLRVLECVAAGESATFALPLAGGRLIVSVRP